MIGRALAVMACGLLVSCGGGSRQATPQQQFISASGPIKSACLRSGRDAASQSTCGCIQLAADQTLTGADQRRGAAFFGNPELAQEVRASDTVADDAFWERWSNFGKAAQQMCS